MSLSRIRAITKRLIYLKQKELYGLSDYCGCQVPKQLLNGTFLITGCNNTALPDSMNFSKHQQAKAETKIKSFGYAHHQHIW